MRRLLVTLVVLAVLLVGADIAGRAVAERGMSTALRQSAGLGPAPSATISGVPFLTQAWRGTYDDVRIEARDVPAEEGLEVDEIDARLSGVRLPLRDVIDRRVEQVPVDSADVRGLIGFGTLDDAAAERIADDRLSVRFSAGSAPDRAAVEGTFDSPLGALALRGEVELRVRRETLQVEVVPSTLVDVPRAARGPVADLIDTSYPLSGLPFGLRARAVSVGPAGVTLTASGSDVVLR